MKEHPLTPMMRKFEEEMVKFTPKSSKIFKKFDIKAEFYAFRWFLLMFAQEFDIYSITR